MPAQHFVALKNEIREMYRSFGSPISSREAHRQAQGVLLGQFAEKLSRAAEAYFRDTSDETGETAANNVLVEYLRQFGELNKPKAVAA